MFDKKRLVLIYGGKSAEHEVSLVSAAAVLANLNAEKYDIIPVGMDKAGCFFKNDYEEMLTYKTSLPVCTDKSVQLPGLLIDGQFAIKADVVFPIAHGPLYEDGALQGLLKLADIAFVGCDVLSSALGMDKDIARRIVSQDPTIRTAQYRSLSFYATQSERHAFCQEVVAALGFPLFVKPCSLGSSVGIHKVNSMETLFAAVDDALRYDETILVEEYIEGREIELAVLENKHLGGRPQVSLPGEIRVHHPDGYYSYTTKYIDSDSTDLIAPTELNPQLVSELQRVAVDIFVRLKCKGMARVDFFVNEHAGMIYFNEINTVPGFTPISMYPKLWQVSGLAYASLLDELIDLAVAHHQCQKKLVTSYQ